MARSPNGGAGSQPAGRLDRGLRKHDGWPAELKALVGRGWEEALARPETVSIALFLLLCVWIYPFEPDDAFIAYRYATNLASGHGLAFNPGEAPVEGYTDFLWVLILALADRLWPHLEVAGPVLGALLSAGTIVLTLRTMRLLGAAPPALLVGGALLAIAGPFVLYAVSGLETALFACLLAALAAQLCRLLLVGHSLRLYAFALLGAALHLTRPEGILAYAIAAATALVAGLRQDTPSPWRRSALLRDLALSLAGFCVLVGVYHAWRIAYFGHWLPTSFHNKAPDAQLGALGALLGAIARSLNVYFYAPNHGYTPFGPYYLLLILLAGIGLARERSARLLRFAIAGIVGTYLLLYLFFVDWMPAMRYHAPLIPLLLLLLPQSMLGESRQRPRSRQPGEGGAAWPVSVAAGMLLLVGAWSLALAHIDGQNTTAATRESLARLGRWLERVMPPGEAVAIGDVGAVSYYSRVPIIDINPRSLADGTIAYGGYSTSYVLAREPGFVILVGFARDHPIFYAEHMELVARREFAERYRLVARMRYRQVTERYYWVYVRKNLPLSNVQLADISGGT